MNFTRFGPLFAAVLLTSIVSASAGGARVKVALLDDAPVYHWRVLKSRYSHDIDRVYSDDIDRALVLREFKRRFHTLPEHFVDEALQREIAEQYNGSKARLEGSLQRSGASMEDYRQFLAEEITLTAFPIFIVRHSKQTDSLAARAKWIASLRQNAKIKWL